MKTIIIILLLCGYSFAQDTVRIIVERTVTKSTVLELLLKINVDVPPDTIIMPPDTIIVPPPDTIGGILFAEWTNTRQPPDDIGAWVLYDSSWFDQKETLFPFPPEDGFLWYHPSVEDDILDWTTTRGWHVTRDSILHKESLHGFPNRWVWVWVRYKYQWVIYEVIN